MQNTDIIDLDPDMDPPEEAWYVLVLNVNWSITNPLCSRPTTVLDEDIIDLDPEVALPEKSQ